MFDDKHHKVLIAEDDGLISEVLSHKLEAEGFKVTVAKDGQVALDELEKNKFDLLLLDLTMPGCDGFQVLTKLKSLKNKMPIIVTSNLSQPEDIKKAKDLGAWSYIIKASVTPKYIVEQVEKCIIEHKC